MHDPYTVAFEILYPWEYPRKLFNILLNRKYNYYHSLITIWHVDPEKDGSDDSCGWSRGRLTEEEKYFALKASRAYSFIFVWEQKPRKYVPKERKDMDEKYNEKRNHVCYRQEQAAYPLFLDAGYTYSCLYNLFFFFLWEEQNRHYSLKRRSFTKREKKWIEDLAYNSTDNLQMGFCSPESCYEDVVVNTYRCWKKIHRPWYKHPKWHIHHWRVQIHLWGNVRRKLFTKCEICNKRFPYRYCPVSNGWGSPKVKWYESEKGLSCGANEKENCQIKNSRVIMGQDILSEKISERKN